MSRDKILDKLKKMKAQADSAAVCSTEAEAQAFAAAMQRLMSEHKILMSEVEHAALDKDEPVEETRSSGMASNDPSRPEFVRLKQRCEWMEHLAAVVAKAHYCRIIVHPSCAILSFAGRRNDGLAAVQTFEYMVKCACSLGRAAYFKAWGAYQKNPSVGWTRGFYRSYLLGFAVRLGERYKEEMDKMKAEWANSGTALMRLTDALVPVNKYIATKTNALGKKVFSNAARVGVGVQNGKAYEEGRRAADGMKLRGESAEVGSSSPGDRRRIG